VWHNPSFGAAFRPAVIIDDGRDDVASETGDLEEEIYGAAVEVLWSPI
jgi:hypothetical protein